MFSLAYEPDRDAQALYWIVPELPTAYAQRVATTPVHDGLYEVHWGHFRGYERVLPGLYRVVGASLVRYAPPEIVQSYEAEIKPHEIEGELKRLEEFAYVPEKVLELGTPEMLDQDLVLMQANFVRFHDLYALALLDIDHLQELVSGRGEDASTEAVNLIAATIAQQARSGDSAYELGGDGFAIIFPFQGAAEAYAAAERIRCAVEELAVPDPRSPSSVLTISAGISAARPNQPTTTLEEADVALQHAKATGRNRVCAFEEPTTQYLAA